MVGPRFCPDCGHATDGARFCSQCGHNLLSASAEPSVTPAAEAPTGAADTGKASNTLSGGLLEGIEQNAKIIAAAAGAFVLLIFGVLAARGGGPSVEKMQESVGAYYSTDDVSCERRGDSTRFTCAVTSYKDGSILCDGAVITQYDSDAGDDFIQISASRDFDSGDLDCRADPNRKSER